MKQHALRALEQLCNTLLRSDPDSLNTLATLDGQCIDIHITDWRIHLYVQPHTNGMHLSATAPESVDTHIDATLFNCLKMATSGGTLQTAFDAEITVRGNMQTGETLQKVLRTLDIDWEAQLAAVVGDTLAPPIARSIQKGLSLGRRFKRSLAANITEYLHYESQCLPPPAALNDFYNDVRNLRDDVDRLAARLDLIIHSRSTQ